jgi:hypothetical protein
LKLLNAFLCVVAALPEKNKKKYSKCYETQKKNNIIIDQALRRCAFARKKNSKTINKKT